ncbi:MAG: hypothetical protein ACODUE_09930 [Synechococcus sp.]
MTRRRLYVLGGFDPRGAGQFQRLLFEQLQHHPLAGGRLRRERRGGGAHHSCWRTWDPQQPDAALEIVTLHWDDLVRRQWPRHGVTLLRDGAWIYSRYLIGGVLQLGLRLSRRAGFTLLWPLVFVLVWAALVGTVVAAAAVAAGSSWPGLALGLGIGTGLVWLGCLEADRRRISWLFRSIRYTDRLARGLDGGLRERLEHQRQLLLTLERSDPATDVVLLGHSCGTYVAAMLAAELKRDPRAQPVLPRLRLLTLGQNLIHLAGLPEASSFRNDLHTLAAAPELPWLDVSSLDDWISGAGVNPYELPHLRKPLHPYPAQRVVPLRQRLGLRSRWSLLNNQFRLHFQYFHAVPAGIDSGGFDLIDELLVEVVGSDIPQLVDCC